LELKEQKVKVLQGSMELKGLKEVEMEVEMEFL
jgi:hypothetical protein